MSSDWQAVTLEACLFLAYVIGTAVMLLLERRTSRDLPDSLAAPPSPEQEKK